MKWELKLSVKQPGILNWKILLFCNSGSPTHVDLGFCLEEFDDSLFLGSLGDQKSTDEKETCSCLKKNKSRKLSNKLKYFLK